MFFGSNVIFSLIPIDFVLFALEFGLDVIDGLVEVVDSIMVGLAVSLEFICETADSASEL